MGEELSGMEYMGLKSLCLRKCWPYKEKLLTGLSGLRTFGKLWAQSAAKCQNVGTHKILWVCADAQTDLWSPNSRCSWCLFASLFPHTRHIHVPSEHCATFLHWEADYRSYRSANWRQKSSLMNNWVGCAPSSCPWLMPQLIIGWYESRTQPITSPSYHLLSLRPDGNPSFTNTNLYLYFIGSFLKGKVVVSCNCGVKPTNRSFYF